MEKFLNYQFIECLQKGSLYSIYRAIEDETKKSVIIKITNNNENLHQEIENLKKECEIGKYLSKVDEYFLKDYEFKQSDDNYAAIIMADINGIALSKNIPKDGFSLETFFDMAIKLAQAVQAMHQLNIMHRDINPNNILITPTNQVKIIDFGSALSICQENQIAFSKRVIKGTLTHISPEQTGRMNRTIDYRTDLYSLGVTYYQLLCNCYPFNVKDPVELMYCHMSQIPLSPTERKNSIPPIVSNIVLKLLNKNAEDRYQSAYGLKHDLELCQQAIKAQNVIENFELGKHDISDRFSISQKLYGREVQIKQLLDNYTAISQGEVNSMLSLVHGYSGIGKTSLIYEIQKPLTKNKGHFISGKFDQFDRNIPYHALIQAFNQLIHSLLTETEKNITDWRKKILRAVSENGQIIIDVLPAVKMIVGEQPPVQKLSAKENQERFELIFQRFISVFANEQHPLVVFIDDLQWADSSTLHLIKNLLKDEDTKYLLFIGAYRDNEIDETHRLTSLINDIKHLDINKLNDIEIYPLKLADTAQLIADSLHKTVEETISLAEIIQQKSNGNPFYISQLLKVFHQDKLIYFENQTWGWNLTTIKTKPIADNVVSLMQRKIEKLPESTCLTLAVAAHIGSQFDLETLAAYFVDSNIEIYNKLQPALNQGVIVLLNENDSSLKKQDLIFKFIHDRLQEAASLLMTNDEAQYAHLTIGQLILKSVENNSKMLAEKSFDILGHFISAKNLLDQIQNKLQLAELSLKGAEKAKESTAYESAIMYAKFGIELLTESSWADYYNLIFSLYKHYATCEYLIGNFVEAEKLYAYMHARVSIPLDKISVYFIQAGQYEVQGDYEQTLDTMRKGLAQLNIIIPKETDQLEIILTQELNIIQNYLKKGLGIEFINNLSSLMNPIDIAIMNLLQTMWTPSYIKGDQQLLSVVSLKMANFTLKHGICELSSIALVYCSFVLGAYLNDYKSAYNIGNLGISLAEKSENKLMICKCYQIFGSTIKFWHESVASCLSSIEQAYNMAINLGSLSDASYAAFNAYSAHFIQGLPLSNVYQAYKKYYEGFLKNKNQAMYDFAMASSQPMRDLLGVNESYDEVKFTSKYSLNSPFIAANYYTGKLMTAYYLDKISNRITLADEAYTYIPVGLRGNLNLLEGMFFIALIYLIDFSSIDINAQEKYKVKIKRIKELFKIWSEANEATCLHKYELILAEELTFIDNAKSTMAAIKHFKSAIKSAEKYKFVQYAALGYERLANYMQRLEDDAKAQKYIKKAYFLYKQWQANTKTKQLENNFSYLRLASPKQIPLHNSFSVTRTMINSQDLLESNALREIAETITTERNLEKLVKKIIKLIVWQVGAQNSTFFVAEKDKLFIVAQYSNEKENTDISFTQSLDEVWNNGPSSIIHLVKRTKENIILSEAQYDKQFCLDPYIAANKINSILCMPFLFQGELKGILYLENKLVKNAFSNEHVMLLKLSSILIAASLENAKEFNAASIYRNNLEKFISTVCHEFRNPTHGITGNLSLLKEAISNLMDDTSIPVNTVTRLSTLNSYIDDIEQCTNYQQQIANAVLDLSKLENKALILKEESFSPIQSINTVVSMFKAKALAKGLNLIFEHYDQQVFVQGDSQSLQTIAINFLTNAIKFTHKGEIRVTLQLASQIDEAVKFELNIKDTGIGLTSDQINNLFKPYSQVSNYAHQDYLGTGIGLVIAKELVKLMHGEIEVTSTPGKGTTFSISFCCKIVNLQESIVEKYTHRNNSTFFKPDEQNNFINLSQEGVVKKILIVEDNLVNQKVLAKFLETKKYQYDIANNGSEAVIKYTQTPTVFSLIFMDIEMPIKNGIEATKEIREIEAKANRQPIRIVGISGNAKATDIELAKACGMNGYITKPCKRETIYAEIESTMNLGNSFQSETDKTITLQKQ